MKSKGAEPSRPAAKLAPPGFQRALLEWFDAGHRDLPWRNTGDPYAVWVSEIMLQQTRVDVVLPRYERFLARFPSVERLAESRADAVAAEWSGLGYYRRAQNLHTASKIIVRDHGGAFPADPKDAASLPGVGTYTAHAVLSIAYGLPFAVVDGNVERVLSRVSLLPVRPRSTIQKEADRLLSRTRPGDANQALMELGATVCSPLSPRCGGCPLRTRCGASRSGRISSYPPPATRPRVVLLDTSIWIVRDRRGRIWIERRSVPPLRGLWMLPWREDWTSRDSQTGGVVTHAIMNRRYRCSIYLTDVPPEEIPGSAAGPGRWVDPGSIAQLPHSSLLTKALESAFGSPRRTKAATKSRTNRSR